MRGGSLGIGGTREAENGELGYRGWEEYAEVISLAMDGLSRRGGKSCQKLSEEKSDSAMS